ncbi:MAG TPA: AraC family transcriptional regulator ligand-binding domain-containing protein [Aquabacterium sp.]|uniref:AraC family transcriptional regulator n=1 Tax=Aquabacterium sp. TaxID=1872578 RepID=UPI002E307A72|nr:AraC family transcriptional regulator ligand-binding domain-containing protein [Aquabacterium sp.]HEX5355065.1 AraC family transcriptional regulator ligand-binding domain-containing protein [Aquabacterium sp.]
MSIALKDLTFSVRYMEVMEGLLRERGAPIQVLLDALGLSEAQLRDPHQTIDGLQYQRALLAARPYCLPGLPLSAQYLAHVPLTIVGPLGLLIMASGTLGDALAAVEKYAGVLFPAYALRVERIKDEVHVVVTRLSDFGEADDLLTEIVLGMFTQFQPFLAEPLRDVELRFRHPASPWSFAPSGALVRAVQFGAAVDEVVFPSQMLRVRTRTGSRLLQVEVTRSLDQMARQGLPAQAFSQQARRAIRTLMDAGKVLHGDVLAEQMQLSRRTLNRRLEEEGTTLAGLISEVRMSLADTLLITTTLPLTDIARRAGFTEVTNFSRAFKRQYGCTPRERRGGR